MAGEKTSGSCGRFQANIFNRNKCQNCFKARELHLLNELEAERAKPVYGGWLCLAPEGTDFENPVQRSRKWQRRFFILFESGGLSFALDELPGTLPQGTVDMLACTDVCDAEPRTGQKNSLCIATPEREVFIRADSRETINGWSEQLCVFLRTNKQNLKKKRKVEPVANQEPSPAKVAATGASFPCSDAEAAHRRGPDPTPAWTEPPGPEWTPADTSSSFLDPLCADRSPNRPADQQRRWDGSPERPDGTRTGQEGGAAVCRRGRAETRPGKREKLPSCGDTAQLCAPPPQRRAKSLDRRTSDTVMTLDLLNFKKGWMVKLEGNGEWKKFWFVLTTDSLRYFKDSLAEETSDLEGEMDLTNVLKVSEYEVQRNYGFQIHTAKAVVTLSAMTAGIRRNWIQALLRNVHPANAPDVASVAALQAPRSPPEVLPKPDVMQDSAAGRAPPPAAKSVAEKRGKGRYKTFDWAELWPQSQPQGLLGNRPPSFMELGDLERQRRREERRKRYESTLGVSLRREDGGQKTLDVSAKLQQEEIEECWRLVERSALRPDKTVPLGAAEANAAEAEKLLRSCTKAVEDLKVQLAESERRRLTVDAQLRAALGSEQQLDSFPSATHEDSRQLNRHNMPEQLLLEAVLPGLWPDDTDGLETRSRVDPQEAAVKKLSEEVELLTAQNSALKQRSQEMLNQLTEADREIARLKAELSSRQRLLEEEQQAKVRIEELEEELSSRNQTLLDLQERISSLQENLREAEARLHQQSEEVMFKKEEREDLLQRLQATEAKLTQLKLQRDRSELTCRELQNQNAELTEEKNLYCERAASLGRRLQDEERLREGSRDRLLSDEEKIQLLVEGMMARTKAVMKLLDVTDGLELMRDPAAEEEEEEEGLSMVNQLKREEEFWSLLFSKAKAAATGDPGEVLSAETMECVMLENQMLLAAHALLRHTEATESRPVVDPDIVWRNESVARSTEFGVMEYLRAKTLMKMSLLTQMSSIGSSDLLKLQPTAEKLHRLHFSQHPLVVSRVDPAAAEALMCLLLQSRQKGELCASCSRLAKESGAPRAEMSSRLPEKQHCGAERRHSGTPNTPEFVENVEILSELKGKIKELEEQLEVLTEEKEEFDQRRKSVQQQQQTEVDKMKATWERGLALMEECHLKVLEELQCLHQLEVERLLMEGGRLLEEESVATATAMEAMERAHRQELQEIQQRSEWERREPPLEDVYRQHREELASCQRELGVLSQQFSMKCLENRHLIQALDAERKALSQCQQENQHLQSRNQELSGHLAEEITRLCSLAKPESLPPSRETDVYEMEVALRVKDSEVCYLKQEIKSLKDKLLSTLKEASDTAAAATFTEN